MTERKLCDCGFPQSNLIPHQHSRGEESECKARVPGENNSLDSSFYQDVIAVLDHLDHEYVSSDIAAVMKRLRKIVGYTLHVPHGENTCSR